MHAAAPIAVPHELAVAAATLHSWRHALEQRAFADDTGSSVRQLCTSHDGSPRAAARASGGPGTAGAHYGHPGACGSRALDPGVPLPQPQGMAPRGRTPWHRCRDKALSSPTTSCVSTRRSLSSCGRLSGVGAACRTGLGASPATIAQTTTAQFIEQVHTTRWSNEITGVHVFHCGCVMAA